MRLRQARLKTRYWSQYPTIATGIWHGAAALIGRVLYNQKGRPTFASLLDRPLPDEHFDFRYGDPPRRQNELDAHTRCNDGAQSGGRVEHPGSGQPA